MSVGIFSWATHEPEDGKYDFTWLDTIMDKLHLNGVYALLATPSGAKPAWMAQKYPEILRVSSKRVRDLQGGRHNHCFTSPAYRRKVTEMNTRLAERYKDHPALIMWHVSNEYSGECHCDLCQDAFRLWMKNKYKTLDAVNDAYWTRFWSHTYTDWSQVESPAPHGEMSVHGLNLDWRRFITHQTIDFFKTETAPLKRITPDIPATANLMGSGGIFTGLNYQEFAKHMDVVSWDAYPAWHGTKPTEEEAIMYSFVHDSFRSMKSGKPFLLMESTPSMVNWHHTNKLKRPGMHKLSSLLAVAHGSDSVQYFQWRKSRGSSEQHHGAVVDHAGHEHNRVFSDVADLGATLEAMAPIAGTTVKPEAAVIYDWENRWLLDDIQGNSRHNRDYEGECRRHYAYFWKNGIPVDIIGMDDDFTKYKLIIAPMLYMLRPGVGERIESFVREGGTFVSGFLSGLSDENGLSVLGGYPGALRKVLGIWAEELDTLYEHDINHIVTKKGESFAVNTFCDLIHAETAEILATYQSDFYAGRPAVTRNAFGKGAAYYMAARTGGDYINYFYNKLMGKLKLKRNMDAELPSGVTVQRRSDGKRDYLFLMNFSEEKKPVVLDGPYVNMVSGEELKGTVILDVYEVRVLSRGR
jgi:beta-galactosidase